MLGGLPRGIASDGLFTLYSSVGFRLTDVKVCLPESPIWLVDKASPSVDQAAPFGIKAVLLSWGGECDNRGLSAVPKVYH